MNPWTILSIGVLAGILIGLGIAWLIAWADQFRRPPLDFDDSVVRLSNHRRVP